VVKNGVAHGRLMLGMPGSSEPVRVVGLQQMHQWP